MKLCRSEMPANDAMRRFNASRVSLLLPRVPISRHHDASCLTSQRRSFMRCTVAFEQIPFEHVVGAYGAKRRGADHICTAPINQRATKIHSYWRMRLWIVQRRTSSIQTHSGQRSTWLKISDGIARAAAPTSPESRAARGRPPAWHSGKRDLHCAPTSTTRSAPKRIRNTDA
ncbi:hypothetical protein EVAR_78295_1 [Eumeta japonica]|uniref:Uncharacterized protein n=1 Tax=Eumeta variegata TaxID=151549 RepID=A0A4C1T334_EUMVA|nr:hypothetical protein EVAR_78295_1 [Eumeta japonica]